MRWRDFAFVICAFVALSHTLLRDHTISFVPQFRIAIDSPSGAIIPPPQIVNISSRHISQILNRDQTNMNSCAIIAVTHPHLIGMYIAPESPATFMPTLNRSPMVYGLRTLKQLQLKAPCIGFGVGKWRRREGQSKSSGNPEQLIGIAIVTSDGVVHMYNLDFEPMWSVPILQDTKHPQVPLHATVLVLRASILQGDEGLIIVGIPIASDRQHGTVFCFVALHARDGELRWKTFSRKPLDETQSNRKEQAGLDYEPPRYNWTMYQGSILRSLPHRYDHPWKLHLRTGTYFVRKAAQKNTQSSHPMSAEERNTELWKKSLKRVRQSYHKKSLRAETDQSSDSVVLEDTFLSERVAAAWSTFTHSAKGGHGNTSSSSQGSSSSSLPKERKIRNVAIMHLPDSVLALHLYTGEHIAILGPLRPNTVYEDVNHDGTIDAADVFLSDPSTPAEQFRCEGRITTNAPYTNEVLHVVRLCHVGQPRSAVTESDSMLQKIHRILFQDETDYTRREFLHSHETIGERTPEGILAATPLTIRRVRQRGIGISEIVHDVIFYTSQGVVASVNAKTGRENWRRYTHAIFGPSRRHEHSVFSPQKDSFVLAPYPHITTYHTHIRHRHVHDMYILIVGDQDLLVLDSASGDSVFTQKLPSPITAPILIGDINRDGVNDLLVSTKKGYVVLVGQYHRGSMTSLHALIFCTLSLVVLLFISQLSQKPNLYTSLFPLMKSKIHQTAGPRNDSDKVHRRVVQPPLVPPPPLFRKRSTD